MTKTVIFSDLDGTFLDDSYSYDKTKPIVNQLNALGGSVVFCSSKTRTEIEFYRKTTDNNEPFISENGSAIFIPKNYFIPDYAYTDKTPLYNIIRLGPSYDILRQKLALVKEHTAAKIVGFGDMTLSELAKDTGLPLNLARLAHKREHDEPFRILEGNKKHVIEAIKDQGLNCTEGGRYLHLTGGTDKGRAVNILKGLYYRSFGQIQTYAVGDGPNDGSMLKAVDKPFFIASKDVGSMLTAWLGILYHMSATVQSGMHLFSEGALQIDAQVPLIKQINLT